MTGGINIHILNGDVATKYQICKSKKYVWYDQEAIFL